LTSFFGDKIFYGWAVVFAGLVISIMGIGSRYCFGVFLKPLEADFGVSRISSSGIFSLYMLLSSFIAVLGGWALDRYGPRKVVLLMATFSGLSFILTSLTSAPWQLFITYSLILSLGTGPTYGLSNSTSARWFVKKRGLVIAITSSGGGAGAIILAPFAAYLVSQFGWRTAFIIFGCILFIVMAASGAVMKKDPADIGQLPDGDEISRPPQTASETDRPATTLNFSLSQACRMHQLWFLGFNWVFLSLSLHMVFVHIVPYAMDAGLSAMDASLVISLIGVANIPGRLVVGIFIRPHLRFPVGRGRYCHHRIYWRYFRDAQSWRHHGGHVGCLGNRGSDRPCRGGIRL